MIKVSSVRDRLYQAYASQRAGSGDAGSAALVYRHDIRPLAGQPNLLAAVTATDVLEHLAFAARKAG